MTRKQSNLARLFGVECCDGIEAHGGQRRDAAGGERDGGKYHGDASEGGQIVRRYAEEQSGHKVRNNERANKANAGAGGGQSEPLPQNHLTESDGENTSFSVSARKTGSSASTAWSCSRTCSEIALGSSCPRRKKARSLAGRW